jgi:CheY-like chemotaxis protein
MPQNRLREIEASIHKKRILVVDDEDGFRDLICDELRRAGYCVDEARNLQEALGRLEDRAYHAALVDIMLTGPHDRTNQDGLLVLQAIKQSRAEQSANWETIKIGTRSIALTAQDDPELSFDMKTDYGADDYMDKHRYRMNIVPEVLRRVENQLKEAHISSYGEFRIAIQFLAGEQQQEAWADRVQRMLQFKTYGVMASFFGNLCDPIAPLMPATGARTPASIDEGRKIITGTFWSKVLALPVGLLVGSVTTVKDLLAGKTNPSWDDEYLVQANDTDNASGRFFELKGAQRSNFVRSVAFKKIPGDEYL